MYTIQCDHINVPSTLLSIDHQFSSNTHPSKFHVLPLKKITHEVYLRLRIYSEVLTTIILKLPLCFWSASRKVILNEVKELSEAICRFPHMTLFDILILRASQKLPWGYILPYKLFFLIFNNHEYWGFPLYTLGSCV